MGQHQIVHLSDATELDGAAALEQVPVVAADGSDTTPASWGPLIDKTSDSATVTRAVAVVAGVRTVEHQVVVSPETPLTSVEGGNPGTQTAGTQAPAWDHQHPKEAPPDPTVEGAKLYAAVIGGTSQEAKAILAPVQRFADVYCCFLGPHTKGANNPMFADAFTEISPGVF